MAALKRGDMGTKLSSNGPYAGLTRPVIFQKKIDDKKDFIIGATASGKKVTGVSYDKKLEILYWTAQRKNGSSKFTEVFKDGDFGGGSGSGGGSDDTKATESMQCYYCAYVFNKAKKQIKTISDSELASTTRFVDATLTLEKCLKTGPKGWRDGDNDVYLKSANKLWEKFGAKTSGNVYFHRGSKFMDNIYKAKSACHKSDKDSPNPQAPGSFSNDKWNPGDIWMSTFPMSDKPLKDFTSNWGELNFKIAELAGANSTSDNTKLLGISLKKTGITAKCQEFKKPGSKDIKKNYTFKGYKYGKKGDFFSSQDIYFETSADEIQFRTFNGEKSWQGEIKGTTAAAGKIGGGNVDFYTNMIMSKTFLPTGGENTLFKEVDKLDFPQKLYEMYERHNTDQLTKKPLLSFADFMKEYKKTTINFKNSKIVCMKFLDVFNSATKKEKDDFVNLLYLYGSSDTEQSSYFVKIY